ncbi:MAG: FkbM family methyltransferase [Oscillospiraceae bacterium]|jgi:FkbM family methyltransferase|nr:FkbM family methyltransferase [Oscillospiraceae bacterium]
MKSRDEIIYKLGVHFKERGDVLSLDCLRFLCTKQLDFIENLHGGKLSSFFQTEFGQESFKKHQIFSLTDKNGLIHDVPPKVVIYGAGITGFFCKSIIESLYKNSMVMAFVDSFKTGTYFEKPILNIEQYIQQFSDATLIIAVANPEKITPFVEKNNIKNYLCFKLEFPFWFSTFSPTASRLWELSGKPTYFSLKELPHSKDEIFVDCGVYDGETIKDFISWSGEYKKIFAFEPDPNCYQISKQNLKDINNLTLIEAAVSDSIGEAMFMSQGVASKLCDSEGVFSVNLTTLDSELAGETVTFIKMDIEGAELSALKGAETIIREQKPKLAICVYHKEEDIFEIPDFLWSVNPGYKFYLRQYTDTLVETVLFAIP